MAVSTDDAQPEDTTAPSEEELLWIAFKRERSTAARQRLFVFHTGFARSIARRHHREHSGGDIELLDLYQHAYTGLLEALDSFDPGHGTPFRPFAAYRISGSILDGITRMSEVREQLSWRRRVRRERLRSLVDTEPGEQAPPVEQLAELAMGLALGFILEGTGLIAQDEGEKEEAAGSAYESAAWIETVAHLKGELSVLPEREQTILRQHYANGVTFDQLALLMSISKGRVSQLHRAALVLLRKRMRGRGHFRMVR